MAVSNYGLTLTKGGQPVGKCKVINNPEVSTEKISSTHHGSGGWAESIPSGLITVGDIELEVICEATTFYDVVAEMEAQTISSVVITDAVDTFTCNGYYLSAKKSGADADNPDLVKATVKIAFTGEPTLDDDPSA